MSAAQPPVPEAAGRVDEHGVDACQVHVADVGVDGGDRIAGLVHLGVEFGHAQVHRVEVHRERRFPWGQRDEVPADAGAQVSDMPGAGVPAGAVPGGQLRGRLLQPLAG